MVREGSIDGRDEMGLCPPRRRCIGCGDGETSRKGDKWILCFVKKDIEGGGIERRSNGSTALEHSVGCPPHRRKTKVEWESYMMFG